VPHSPKRKKEYAKERWAANKDVLKVKQAAWRDLNRPRLRLNSRERRRSKRAMCLVAAARVRARRTGTVFALSPTDIDALQSVIDLGRCELSGVELTLDGGRLATSPSLDRVVPSLGYVTGNVRIVCHALNAGMGNWGQDALRRIVEIWLSNHGKGG